MVIVLSDWFEDDYEGEEDEDDYEDENEEDEGPKHLFRLVGDWI